MGLYDIVLVACPNCDKANEFQSKGGDCTLSTYHLGYCPKDVLMDVNRHSPVTCECGTSYEVELKEIKILSGKPRIV